MADPKLPQKLIRENPFKRLVTRLVLLAFLNQNLAFATQSIIELDVQGSQTPQRLHTILPSSKIADVSHLELDTEKHQVAVYRQEATQLLEDGNDPSSVHSEAIQWHPVIIPLHDIQNLPWELEPEQLTLFILNHTAWLSPLDEDGYKLEFRGGLLGGGGKFSIGRQDRGNGGFPQRSRGGRVTITPYCSSNPNWRNDGTPCGKPQYTPPVDNWQKNEQQKTEQFIKNAFRPRPKPIKRDSKQEAQQKKIQVEKQAQIVCELQKKKENPLLYADYEHMKHLQQLINTDSWENVFKYADKVGISRSDVLKIDRLEKMTFEGFLKKSNPFYESYEHKKHLQQLINTDSWKNVFKYADKAGISREDVLKVDRLEKMTFTGFMQKTNPFYGDYEKVKQVQRLINTASWESVYNYADQQGISREDVQYVNSRRTENITFDGYMREAFDDQVLEDWGVRDWREAAINEAEVAQFMRVGLPDYLAKKAFQKLVQTFSKQTQELLGACNKYKKELFARERIPKSKTTLKAAEQELKGNQIDLAKQKGITLDHATKVRNAQNGLLEYIEKINNRLGYPKLSDVERKVLQEELAKVSKLLDHTEGFVPRVTK